MNPKVTVYITNYNYGHYLDQAIQSVLKQTFQDFEVLVIDDGSMDDSMEVIKRYESRENVFTILQKNKGLSVSNNIALKMARGAFLMRLDADDYLDPRALEIMVSTLEKDPDLGLVFPDYYEVDHDGEIMQQVRRHDFANDVKILDQPAHGACTMIRTRVLVEVGGYDESFNKQDGYDLWFKVIDDYKVGNINLPLFYYRKHGNSLSSDDRKLLKVRAAIKKKRVKEEGIKPISVLAIVPTRGSKMDPRSFPLEKLIDKFLIDWTLDSALKSSLLTDILVTTPDKDVIRHVSDKYAGEVITIERLAKLARINTGFEQTIIEALESYEENHSQLDAVMVLNITAPFKSNIYIEKAIHTFQLHGVDAVRSVIIDDGYFYEHDGSGLRPRNRNNSTLRLERTNLYREAGGIMLIRRSVINTETFHDKSIGHIIVDQKAAFHIKTVFDFKIAEVLSES
jgi:CMP-N-acetylneuraminic acid synthetase